MSSELQLSGDIREKSMNPSKRQVFSLFHSLFRAKWNAVKRETFSGKSLVEPKFHWTWNNHLLSGFHKDSSGAIDKNIYFCKMDSLKRKVSPAFKEAQIAARLILNESKKIGQEVFLCVSGGIDSESMLRAFMAEGERSFHAVILRFNDNLNDFDIENVIQFCEAKHVSYEVFDLNVLDFFESGKYLEYGKMYQCQSPQLAVHLHFLDHIRGVPVLSWQPPEVSFHYNQAVQSIPFYNFGLPGHLYAVLLRYFVQRKKFGVPFFFAYTPELVASFFRLPLLQTMIYFGDKGADINYCYCIKCLTYRDSGFSVKPRKASWTGFEKVRKYYDTLDNKQYGVAFNDRYRTPLEELNPLPKKYYQIVPEEVLFDSQQVQNLEREYEEQLFHKEMDVNLIFKKGMAKLLKDKDEISRHLSMEFMKETNELK